MPFRSSLLNPTGNPPHFWAAAAIATLVRLLFYHRRSWLNQWVLWSGGEHFVFFPYNPPLLSSCCVVMDGRQLILAFEGTRNGEQLTENIFAALPRTSRMINGQAHSFFLYCAEQWRASIHDVANHFRNNSPILITGHSLGGAVAQIYANHFRGLQYLSPQSCVTFGQPFTGNQLFCQETGCPYLRIAGKWDLVRTVPPPVLTCAVYRAGSLPSNWNLGDPFYVHINPCYVFDKWPSMRGRYLGAFDNADLPNLAQISIVGAGIGFLPRIISEEHWMGNYTRNLINRAVQDRRPRGYEDVEPLLELNGLMDADDAAGNPDPPPGDDAAIPLPPPPPPAPPPPPIILPRALPVILPGQFAWPDVVFPETGEPPILPPDSQGRITEARSITYRLIQYGGYLTMANTYRGRDRRMLTTLHKACTAILARDARAAVPRKTARLSTRQIMFADGGPGLRAALLAVQGQAGTLLAQTR